MTDRRSPLEYAAYGMATCKSSRGGTVGRGIECCPSLGREPTYTSARRAPPGLFYARRRWEGTRTFARTTTGSMHFLSSADAAQHGAAEAKHRRSRPAAAARLRANARAGARRWLFVKDHMSASADPHLAIIDADVGYFRRHPRRRHRVRPRSQADVEALAQGARTHRDCSAIAGCRKRLVC